MSRDGIVTSQKRNTMGSRDPFTSNLSTGARSGQVDAASELRYRGFEEVIPIVAEGAVRATEAYAKIKKKEEDLAKEAEKKAAADFWAHSAFVRDAAWQEMTAEDRDKIAKEAAARGQLPGDYYAKSLELKFYKQLAAQGFSDSIISEGRDKYYYTEQAGTLFKTEDARIQRETQYKEQMNNSIIQGAVEAGFAVYDRKGQVDREATLDTINSINMSNKILNEANDETLWNLVGITPDQYQVALNNNNTTQIATMNSKLTQAVNKLMLDAGVKPLIIAMRNTDPTDFEKMNDLRGQFLTVATEASNKVNMLGLPQDVVTETRNQITNYTSLIGVNSLKDVDAINTFKANLEYIGYTLEANALADPGMAGSIKRAEKMYGPTVTAAWMQYNKNIFGDTPVDLPESAKKPILINATYGQLSGSIPTTGDEQIDKAAYNLAQQPLYSNDSKALTKQDLNIKENLLNMADIKFKTSNNNPSHKGRIEAQKEAVDMFTNKNVLANIDAIPNESPIKRSLLDSSYAQQFEYADTMTRPFLSGNNATLDLINFDVAKGEFVRGSEKDATEKEQASWMKPLKGLGNWITKSNVDDAISELNKTLEAMGNNRTRYIGKALSKEDLNEIARTLTDYINSSKEGKIKFLENVSVQ